MNQDLLSLNGSSIQSGISCSVRIDLENASYSSIEQLCRPKPLNVQVVDDQEEEDKSAGKCRKSFDRFFLSFFD